MSAFFFVACVLPFHPALAPSRAASKDAARKPNVEFVMGVYAGDVTAVTKGSVTIDGAGSQSGPNRDIEGVRTFAASEVLKKGGFARDLGRGFGYRLQDLREGDSVRIRYSRINGIDVCTHLSIHRRPGGKVPPSPAEDPDLSVPYDVIQNAYQALEEQGLPAPPFWMPFPVWVPTAPAPREVSGRKP